MRIGIIDLGTNSVRFDVNQLGPGKRIRHLHREKIMVRLGQGIFLHGRLDRSAIRRSLSAFQRFKRTADQYRVQKILAFGTSALREASDRDAFLRIVRERTGIEVRVISGAEEADLIALGILSQEKHLARGRFALVDIGGGSTEVSICRGKVVLRSHSFPLGTARLQQLFLRQSPPSPAQLTELRRFVRATLLDTTLNERWPKVDRVVGSSGTIRTLARMLGKRSRKKGGKSKSKEFVDREKLSALVTRMSGMTTGELLSISGMEAKRVDMILGGATLFEECMKALGARKFAATELSLRDGIMEEELHLYQQGSTTHLSLHMDELYEKAVRLGGDLEHLRYGVTIAERIFEGLRRLHGLGPDWKIYLDAAMILRNVGAAINLSRQGDHSYYVIKSADLPAMDQWEVELVARLCLLVKRAKIDPKELEFTRNKARREAFPKLLALLKLADALDPGPEIRLRLGALRIGRDGVRLAVSGRDVTGLEALSVAKVSPHFESAFGRPVGVTPGR